MRSNVGSSGTGFWLGAALALSSCGDGGSGGASGNPGGAPASSAGSNATAGAPTAGSPASGSGGLSGSGGSAAGLSGQAGSGAGSAGSAGSAGAGGSGPVDPCGDALFCEKFDSYAGVTAIADQQKFGPWHAALKAGASMGLDGTHKLSGGSALHVHIDGTVNAGGRLFSDGDKPLFANQPTHLYGRMMMYIDPNGTSVHWTFFGMNGDAEPNSPAVGRNAQYMMSSLPQNSINTYSFVYGLQAQGNEGFRDCSSRSTTAMPSTWACVSFEMDSVARKLRMYKDGAPDPILSIDDHGKACVPPASITDPWYGPAVSQLFVGAWSFHPMNGPLDVWIDDLVVDTKPVLCPAQ